MGKRSRRAGRYASGEASTAADSRPAPPEVRSADPTSIVVGIVGTLFGLSAGYVVATQLALEPTADAPSSAAAPTTPASGGATPALADEEELQALRTLLSRDPENVGAAVALGDRLYDAGRFAEAVPYYRTAMQLDPTNVNVSTDLGTALFNSGRPDDALAQYERSLAIDGDHAQTLFNIGIVSFEGKSDPRRAIDSWQELLATHPTYPERARVEGLLAQARAAL